MADERTTDAWSITDGYWDTDGTWHETSEETRTALRAAMGADGLDEPPEIPPPWFVTAGDTPRLQEPCDLVLEDGTVLTAIDELPHDLPLGYHELQPLSGGAATWLVITPRRCPLPERAWGWAVQLYALRSRASWGHGDLGDLRELAAWTAGLGGRVVMINPLHATYPAVPQQHSPYFATSRVWHNILYLRISDIPGAVELGARLRELDEAGRALDDDNRLDRDAVYRLKDEALRVLFERAEQTREGRARFDRWRVRQRPSLPRFARWCALAEVHGPNFAEWPTEHRHPDSAAVETFAKERAASVRFHEWCQWQLDVQLASAGRAGTALMTDVAVGFDPFGADGWAYQDLVAPRCRVGAPPDTFNPLGQDWGLPAFVPWKLRAARYEPFIDTIRSAMAHGGGMRIDHVMGLFRLYWIPPAGGPRDGAYVRYDGREHLDLVALEATRNEAFVVGEDLGTVEDEARAELAHRNVLSYKLVWFEKGPTSTLPEQALAAVTTHDLATIAGVWTGSDTRVRKALGVIPEDSPDEDVFLERLREIADIEDDAPIDDVIVRAYEALARAPSRIVLATLEDAVAMQERPNVPGTIDERPNWRIPLTATLEQLTEHPLARAVARALDEGISAGDR